jgi:thiol-disulfide isomerase/thioredoxin
MVKQMEQILSKTYKTEVVMKNILLFFVVGSLLSLCTVAISAEPKDDSILPEIVLVTPKDDEHRKYLGITSEPGEPFQIADIDADIIIIELFSMYCPFCQKEAPLVNELYRKATEHMLQGLSIKIIGLGASNSQFEVEHFGNNYEVEFPLFPDKDMGIYKALGGDGTPGFVAYKIKGVTVPVNVLRNSGGFYNAEDFLKDVINNSGL